MRFISPMLGLSVLCLHTFVSAAPSSSPLSASIIGRVPTATAPVITNVTEPGKNPAQGDVLKATYIYADPDNDLVDTARSVFSWSAAGTPISGATAETFTPLAAQNKKFLTFAVTPASLPPADPFKATAAVTSSDSGGPVLPARAQLLADYSRPPNSARWGDAYMYCASQNKRLPTVGQLQTLFTTYTRSDAVGTSGGDDLKNTYGWGGSVFWANTGNETRHDYVYVGEDGRVAGNSNSNIYWYACSNIGIPELLPAVIDVSIPNPATATSFSAVYTYYGNATIPDRSRFQWYTVTSSSGAGKIIATGAGATTKTYTPVAADAGKYLMIEITPASYDNVVGAKVTSVSAMAVVAAPLVSNVSISGYDQWGTPQIDGTLKGEYTYEANGGSADASTYRWLGGATASTSRTYKLTKADRGKTLTFEVTAKNASGTLGNTQGVAASKRVSIFKQFVKPDKQKYTRLDPPVTPGDDLAKMNCTFSGAQLPTRDELSTLFQDETGGGSNTTMCSKHDWPVNGQCANSSGGNESRYWTDEKTTAGQEAYHVNLSDGVVSKTYIGNAFYVACINR